MSDVEKDQTDTDLDYVRDKRIFIIDKLIGEKNIPEDVRLLQVAAGLLADMDRVSLGKKRIKTDQGANANANATIEMLARIFNNPNSKTLGQEAVQERLAAPSLSEDLPMPEVLPGELDTKPVSEDYEAFMTRTGGNTD